MKTAAERPPSRKAQRGGSGKCSVREFAFNSWRWGALGREWPFDPTTSRTALTNGIALLQSMW